MKTCNAKIYSKETITQVMDDARKSISNGESICSIARRHQMPHTTLHQWINKYIPEYKTLSSNIKFVEVKKSSDPIKAQYALNTTIEISFYGAIIKTEETNLELVLRSIKAASYPLAPQNI